MYICVRIHFELVCVVFPQCVCMCVMVCLSTCFTMTGESNRTGCYDGLVSAWYHGACRHTCPSQWLQLNDSTAIFAVLCVEDWIGGNLG